VIGLVCDVFFVHAVASEPETPAHGNQKTGSWGWERDKNSAGRITGMLANYINAAMEQAVYEIIEDEGTYWGEIPGFQGVWARHLTLEGCRRELRDALGDWIALRLQLNLFIPTIANIDLNHLNNPYEAHYA
jgi:predicted RNase H-like HicB family nuclease